MTTPQEDRLVCDWWSLCRELEELRANLQSLGYLPRIRHDFDGAPIKASLTKVIPEPKLED